MPEQPPAGGALWPCRLESAPPRCRKQDRLRRSTHQQASKGWPEAPPSEERQEAECRVVLWGLQLLLTRHPLTCPGGRRCLDLRMAAPNGCSFCRLGTPCSLCRQHRMEPPDAPGNGCGQLRPCRCISCAGPSWVPSCACWQMLSPRRWRPPSQESRFVRHR